jgi:aldehyde dehydrogenase (NAD+)
MVVTPGADIELAVQGALFSGFGPAGQRCMSLGTLLVHESVHDEFIGKLAAAVSAAAIGDPAQDVLYGPVLARKFADRSEGYLGWIQPHHTVLGSTGVGRITAATPALASSVTPATGCSTTRRSWTGSRPATRCSARRPSARSSAS